jgi:hypothetical protein
MKMKVRTLLVVSACFAAATAAVLAASSARRGLVVHEWGTFTSVAGPDGRSVDWTPLSGPQDLPCFVERQKPSGLTSIQVKGRDIFGLLKLLPTQVFPQKLTLAPPVTTPALPAPPPPVMIAKIRMETPVLYFYSPEAVTADVKVSFPQGAMSEWYPQAVVPPLQVARPLAAGVGTIQWPSVNIVPGAKVAYPQDRTKSHYYAARDVDAAPVQVGTQYEKFLFYRGLADFQPSIIATVERNGDVTAAIAEGTPHLVLFENRGGRVGYRIAKDMKSRVTMSRPAPSTVDALRADLEDMLVGEGLFRREAKAMVETWRDSWFEEGTRLFYVIRKSTIDQRLPLAITPAPAEVARVFVGRLELITPEMKDEVERAIVANDLDALNGYGRFLDSIAAQIADRPSMSANPARVGSALKAVALSHPQPAACK